MIINVKCESIHLRKLTPFVVNSLTYFMQLMQYIKQLAMLKTHSVKSNISENSSEEPQVPSGTGREFVFLQKL